MTQPETKEPDPKSKGWRDAPPFNSITAAYQDGGGAMFWGLRYNGEVHAITQVPGGWSKWYTKDWSGPGQPKYITQMAATVVQGGCLQFWALDQMSVLWSAAQAQPGAPFEPWERGWNDSPPKLQRITAVHRQGMSSAEVWAIQSDYSIISCYKRSPDYPNRGNTWSRWEPWASTPDNFQITELAATLQNDGRAALWAIDTNLQLWCCFETSPGGAWTNWAGPNWNGAPKLFHIVACQQGGSRGAALWAVKQEDYSLINTYELTPGGSWSEWSAGGWLGAPPVIGSAAAQQTDGTVRLWVTQSKYLRLISIAQTSPGGDWGKWDPDPNIPPESD